MNILVTGGTGLAGAEVLREAAKNPAITSVINLSRREGIVFHPKIKTILHKDFLNYDGMQETFSKVQACIWCLGISQMQTDKKTYEIITRDYAVAAGRAMKKANPGLHFIFLSGAGVFLPDEGPKSKPVFSKIKGETEFELKKIFGDLLTCARPPGIRPVNKNPQAPALYKLMNPLYPFLEFVYPKGVIKSDQLGRALIHEVIQPKGKAILINEDLKNL